MRDPRWLVTVGALLVALVFGLPGLADYLSRQRDDTLAAQIAAARVPTHVVVVLDAATYDCDAAITGVYRCTKRVGP